ncbi:MAG: tyrosine-type recombinase/integrase [Candidatus Binatia bacterium]
MAMLLYGAGLRLMECLQLRVKDVDFTTNQIIVRAGRTGRPRVGHGHFRRHAEPCCPSGARGGSHHR